jgi:hypothetical protein
VAAETISRLLAGGVLKREPGSVITGISRLEAQGGGDLSPGQLRNAPPEMTVASVRVKALLVATAYAA